MSKPILMPQVGQDLTEGKLIEWRVKVGDKVAKGDIVAVVESEKASFDVEAFEAGTVLNLLYDEGATTKVLAPLLFVGDPTEDAATPHSIEQAKAASEDGAVIAPIGVGMSERAADAQLGRKANGAPRSSPFARRLAKSNGIEIAAIVGTGPHGAVVARDVKSVIQAADPAPSPAGAGRPHADSGPPGTALRSLESASAPPQSPAMRAHSEAAHRAWLRKGEGPPLVMIHGFGADLNGWRVLVAAAALRRPVLAVDLPGHGRSAGLERVSLQAMADAVAAVLADEGVTSADLIGHSLGAAIAVAMAQAARFTVRSLFLIAPAGLGPDINSAFLAGFARARSEESLAPWMRLLVADESAIGPALIGVTAQTRSEPGVPEAQDRVARSLFPDGTQAFSIRLALAATPCPVRVVFGADDRIIPARHAAGLPGTVAVHIFPGVGHMPHLEARETVARLLSEHLRTVS